MLARVAAGQPALVSTAGPYYARNLEKVKARRRRATTVIQNIYCDSINTAEGPYCDRSYAPRGTYRSAKLVYAQFFKAPQASIDGHVLPKNSLFSSPSPSN